MLAADTALNFGTFSEKRIRKDVEGREREPVRDVGMLRKIMYLP